MKTTKRILAVFLAALLLATAAPLSFAQDDVPGYISWDLLSDLGLVNDNQAAGHFLFPGGRISTPGGVSVLDLNSGTVLENQYPSDSWTMIPSDSNDLLECAEIHLPRVIAPSGYVFAGWKRVPEANVFDDSDNSVYWTSYVLKQVDIGRFFTFEAVFEEDPGYLSWSQLDMFMSNEQAVFYFSFPGGMIAEPGGVSVFNCQTGELEENQYPSDGWTMVPVSGSGYDTQYDSTIHLPRVLAPAGFVFAGWERVPMDFGDTDSSVYEDSYTVKMHDTGRVATFKAAYEVDNGYRTLQDYGMMSENQAAFYFAFPGGTISQPGGVQVYNTDTGLFDVNEHPSDGWTMLPAEPIDCLVGSEIHLPRVMAPSGFVFAGWKRVPKMHEDYDDSVYQDVYTIKDVDIDGRITTFEAVFRLDQSFVPRSALSGLLDEEQAAFYFMFPGGTISEPGGVQTFDSIVGELKNVYEYPSDGWTMVPTTAYACAAGDEIRLPRVLAPAGFVFGGWKRVPFFIAADWDASVYQDTYTVKNVDVARVVAFEAVFEPDPALVPWTLLNSCNYLNDDQAAFYFAFPCGTIAEADGVRVFDVETGAVYEDQFPSDGWTMVPTEPIDCLEYSEIHLPRVNAPAGFTFAGWKRVPFVEQDFNDAVYTDIYTVQSSDIDGRYGVFEAVYEPLLPSTGDYTLSGGESMRLTLRRGEEAIFTCTAEEARYYKLTWDVLTDVSGSTGKIKYHLYDADMKQVFDVGILAYGGNLQGMPLLAGETAHFGLAFEGYEDVCDSINISVTMNEGALLPASGSQDGLTWTFSPEGYLALNGDYDCLTTGGDALTSLGFYSHAVKRLFIGAGVRNFFECLSTFSFGDWKLALVDCEAIELAPDHPQYVSDNGMILDREQTTLLLWWNPAYTETVHIPESVTTIAPFAFSPFLLFELQDAISSFGARDFFLEYKLPPMPREVIGSSALEAICDYAFANCFKLASFTWSDSVRYIGDAAFADCISLMELPDWDSLEEIGEAAFRNCWLLNAFRVPDTTTVVGEGAFSGCFFMESVSIGRGVTVIEEDTFARCYSLQKVSLGNRLEEIKDDAFTGCYRLRALVLPASLRRLGNIQATLDQSLVVRNAETQLGDYELPLPSMDYQGVHEELPFSLQQVDLSEDTPDDIERMLQLLSQIAIVKEVGGEMIGLLAYQGNIEKGLAFENAVWEAFPWGLEEAASPADSDFLTTTVYGHPDSTAQTFAQEKNLAFADIYATIASGDCGDDAHWTLNGLGTLTISGTGDMWDYTMEDLENGDRPEYYEYAWQITSVAIEDGITSIGEDTFVGLPLQSLSISNSVVRIGPAAFSNCYYLEEVAIPDSVTTIGENAFEHCKSLQRGVLSANLTTIETGLFIGCVNLTEITIPAGVKTIGPAAFYNCDALQKAIIHSPDCVFTDEIQDEEQVYDGIAPYALPETTVIYGRAGSTAEVYAQTYGRQFVNHYTGAETKAATCTEAGVMTYTCDCGDTYTEEIPVLAHNYVTETVNSDCKTHGYIRTYCTVGGEETERTELPLADHTWDDGVVTLEPTEEAPGVRTYTCTVCSATRTEEIPQLTPAVQPGDINGDGVVNSKDLTRLMKYLSGEDVAVEASALDVNGDGVVNNKDLTRLMKYLAGEDVQIFITHT